jgi:FKBP-type peptidyl-prolyl cis-trans isomerase
MKYLIFSFLALAFLLEGCKVETEQDRRNVRADLQIQEYLIAQKLNMQKTSSGLYYSITPGNVANGRTPKDLEEVAIFQKRYRIADGLLVDSTDTSIKEPEYFVYGNTGYTTGLQEALSLMKEGDKATLIIPPQLAYNDVALPKLPPYSIIRMELQLVSTRNEEERIQSYIDRNKLKVDIKTDTVRVVKFKSTTDTNKIINGKTVSIKYTGRLLRNVRLVYGDINLYKDTFDSGTIDVLLGGNKVVPGFEAGIKKLKLGEKAIVVFPSVYGYGATGSQSSTALKPGIPAYSPLSFEIELVSVK